MVLFEGSGSLSGLLLVGSWQRLPFEGWAEEFCFSVQTPIGASEFMKRSDNLTYSSAWQAARITKDLWQLHWDNCKVNFDRTLAHRYVLRALREGHNAASILKCYERALQECHAMATDRTA